MNIRDSLVITGACAAVVALATLFASPGEASTGDTEDAPMVTQDTGSPADARPDSPAEDQTVDIRPPEDHTIDVRTGVEDSGVARTAGTIEGRVSMAASLFGSVPHFHIRVSELANPNARGSTLDRAVYDRISPRAFAVPSNSTPRFRLEDIPFSPYGYRVQIIANGCNGSSQITRVDAGSPDADVSLALTVPCTFTVRLRDQHMNPHAEWDLDLRPVGEPAGRQMLRCATDRFGVALMERVVQGDYLVSSEGRQLDTVTVQPITIARAGYPISVQSATIEVPVGINLRVEVFGPTGGLPDSDLTLYKTDTVENRRFEVKTDFGGVFEFEHLEAGRYQLDVARDGYQHTSRSVRIPKEGSPDPVKLRLTPLR